MKFRSLIVAAMFVPSCASQQPPGLSGTKNPSNYNRDLYECQREATFAGRDNKQQVNIKNRKKSGKIAGSADDPALVKK